MEQHVSPHAAGPGSGRLLVAGLGALALIVVGYFSLGMPGMDHGGSTESGSAGHAGMVDRLGPDEFAAGLRDPDVVVVNVHTPYAGELPGTDRFIPFDDVAGSPDLPPEKEARILFYCETGRMSLDAAAALMEAGYSNVADLEGGMRAWQASGRAVARRAR